jgi:hypothetical protein
LTVPSVVHPTPPCCLRSCKSMHQLAIRVYRQLYKRAEASEALEEVTALVAAATVPQSGMQSFLSRGEVFNLQIGAGSYPHGAFTKQKPYYYRPSPWF